MQAIIQAGTESVEWISQEFAGVDLCDKRLDRRLVMTAAQLAKSPGSPINEACGDWASTQAAYRLFDNHRASSEAILAPHIEETAKRMAACTGPLLVMQDTVFFCYGQHPKTRGLGPIGNSNVTHERGLIVHNALAFSASGLPLGMLSQRIWARQEVPEEGYQEKIERLQVTPIEEKESSKWLLALEETVARTPGGVMVVTVADRESDFFEFLAAAQEHRASFLIRARTDRLLVPEESAGHHSLLEALAHAPLLGSLEVEIPGNGKRKARSASVAVHVAQVTIKPPPRRGAAKVSGSIEPIAVNAIWAAEKTARGGAEPISWVLLTNLPGSLTSRRRARRSAGTASVSRSRPGTRCSNPAARSNDVCWRRPSDSRDTSRSSASSACDSCTWHTLRASHRSCLPRRCFLRKRSRHCTFGSTTRGRRINPQRCVRRCA
jgi:hypothetical protein